MPLPPDQTHDLDVAVLDPRTDLLWPSYSKDYWIRTRHFRSRDCQIDLSPRWRLGAVDGIATR